MKCAVPLVHEKLRITDHVLTLASIYMHTELLEVCIFICYYDTDR